MDYTIEFSIAAEDEPIVFDSVVLADETNSFGVRTTVGGLAVSANSPMTQVSPGMYEYTLDINEFLTYESVVKFVQDGVISFIHNFFGPDAGSVPPTITDGRYATYAGMKAKFGENQLLKWGEVNGNDISGYVLAIERAMQIADVKVDSALAGCAYTIPFTTTPGIPLQIRDIADALAGIQLYENQGVTDFNEQTGQPIHKYQWHHKNAMQQLSMIKTGILKLALPDGSFMLPSTNYPQFVEYA